MKELSIREIEIWDPQYLDLNQAIGGVFNDPAWMELFGSRLRLYGIFDSRETLIGAFNLLHTRIYGLRYLKNPLCTPHNALIYTNKAETVYKRNAFEKSLHTSIAAFLKTQKVSVIQFGLAPEIRDVQPYLWGGFKVSPSYTYQLNLDMEQDQILAGFDSKLRSDIVKAQKDGVTVEKTEDFISVGALVRRSLDRRPMTEDGRRIERILSEYPKTGKSFAIAANRNGRMIAAVYCVFDSTTAYYILGGYDPDQKQRGAAAFALQGAILHARSLGLKIFDFEGSMVPSIEAFFRGFGGELVPRFTVHRAWLSVEMVLKFFKRSIF